MDGCVTMCLSVCRFVLKRVSICVDKTVLTSSNSIYIYALFRFQPHKCDLILKNAKLKTKRKKNIIIITIDDNNEQEKIEWKPWTIVDECGECED